MADPEEEYWIGKGSNKRLYAVGEYALFFNLHIKPEETCQNVCILTIEGQTVMEDNCALLQ